MYFGSSLFLLHWHPILVKVEGKMLVHDKDIMHLLLKIRIPLLAIIPYLERLDFGFVKNCPYLFR